jgi:predicted dehydrogenase
MKILVAGLGSAGQRHCRNIRTIFGDNVELLALRSRRTSPTSDERHDVARELDPALALKARTFFTIDEAIGECPDAVIIANPSSLHLPIAKAAADAGCAIFLEKPLSHSWEGIPELLSLIERKNLVSFVGYQWRFHPMLEWLKSYIDSRPLGPFFAATITYGEYLPDWHPYEDYRKSYAAKRQLGGGVLLTQIHDFDYACWLLGWPEEVYTIGGHMSDLEIDVEDVAATLMKCTGKGGNGTAVSVHQDILQKPPVRSCEFIAEGGKVCVDLLGGRAKAFNSSGTCVCEKDYSSFSRNEMFLAEMRHFLNCVDLREQSLIPAKEGARSLAVALAALRSLGSGRPEAVVYP